jgi:hypothetical protein
MSEPKTRPTQTTLAAFLVGVEDPQRRADCTTVAKLMQKITGEKAVIWGTGIVGFGRYGYRYANGKDYDWPVCGFSPRKNDLTLYLMRGFDGEEALLAQLGKHKISKACLYVKALKDVDMSVLERLITRAVEAMEPQRIR